MSVSTINCPFCHGWIELEDGKVKGSDGEGEKLKEGDKPEEAPYYEAHVKPAIVWIDEYNLGIEDLDKQHRKIADLINKINISVKTGHRDKKLINGILSELSNYVKEHFAFEEQLFMGSDYPRKKQHEETHKYFTKQVVDLYHASKTTVVDLRPILGFLTGWFKDHTQGTDRQYVKYLDQDLVNK